MAAAQAFVVVEDVVIDELTEFATGRATGGSADETTEQGSGDTADHRADGTGGHTGAGTTGGSGQGADSAACLASPVEDFDMQAVAIGTDQGHGMTPVKMGIGPPLRIRGMQREEGDEEIET
jgi:hypothetical protein